VRSLPALIWLAYVGLLVFGLLDNIRGPFFPDILNELHLNGTLGSTFFATTSLLAFCGSWLAPRVAHRYSSLYLLNAATLGVGLGFAAIALSPRLGWLLPSCAFFGLGYGALNLAQNLVVAEVAPLHLRRRIFSGLHAMYGLAALLAPLTASASRWMGMSWRDCFLCLAVLPIVLATIGLKFRAPVRDHHSQALQNKRLVGREWLLCIGFSLMLALYLWGEISVGTRLVLWLRTERSFSPDAADFYLSGFFLTLLAGRLLFGFLHFERLSNWTILCASAGLSAVSYLMGLWLSPLWFVLVGFTMAPFYPIAMEQVATSFQAKSARALGFVLGFGSFSVVILHLSLGWCTDRFGLSRALYLGPGALACIFLALFILRGRKRLH
jgi:FHS family glucose/mannose:H+ symporter-like MFS transporter